MFTKSKDCNQNYLASIVKIDSFRPHPNADKLKVTSLYGNNVITGIQAEPGLYCYFPLECAISTEFLSYTNSFRESTYNADTTKKGMFENSGRVKALKLRGSPSEGYIIPISILEDFAKCFLKEKISITEKFVGTDFDTIGSHQICKKYIPKGLRINNSTGKKSKGNVKKYESKLVENQFQFHQDTAQLKREINKVNPDDYISIVNKIHGCNFIVSNVLIKKKLSIKDKIAKFFGVNIHETEYGMLYSSRTVIKNVLLNDEKEQSHFYDADIWKIVADKVYPSIAAGISVTGEIVGFTPSGKAIQPNYDYGCVPGNLDFYVFKVTYTSATGQVYTFSHRETIEFCQKYGFKMPETYYYGKARDLFPELDTENHWHDNFLEKLKEKYLEKKCDICKNDVWAEGVILRIDKPFEWEAYKLKSFAFLEGETKQLDSGVVDVETEEANKERSEE